MRRREREGQGKDIDIKHVIIFNSLTLSQDAGREIPSTFSNFPPFFIFPFSLFYYIYICLFKVILKGLGGKSSITELLKLELCINLTTSRI